MSRRNKPKSKGKPRLHNRIWCREALSLARLIPPSEVLAQACFCCDRKHREEGFGVRLYEVYDAYGRVVFCENCLKTHIAQLEEDAPKQASAKQKRQLQTYTEWIAEADIAEIEAVLNRMKGRMNK